MSALCKQVGMTLVKSISRASGPLYGTFFLRMAAGAWHGQRSWTRRGSPRPCVPVSRVWCSAGPCRGGRQDELHGKQTRITVAAGLDETTFGTDAAAIVDAIIAADQGAGVVVLMDLGSAVLSAELACELLDDDLRDRVRLCPASLVEGLVVAARWSARPAERRSTRWSPKPQGHWPERSLI